MPSSIVALGLALTLGIASAQGPGGRESMIAQDGESARHTPGFYGMMPHAGSHMNGGETPFNFVDNNAAYSEDSIEGHEGMWQPPGVECGLEDCADPCPDPCPCTPCGQQYTWQWGDDDVPWGTGVGKDQHPKTNKGLYHGYPYAASPHDGFHHRWGHIVNIPKDTMLTNTIEGERGCYWCRFGGKGNGGGSGNERWSGQDASTSRKYFGKPSKKDSNDLQITLSLDFVYLMGHMKEFDNAFRSDIAHNLPQVDKSAIVVTNIAAGSVLVSFSIYNSPGASRQLVDVIIQGKIAFPNLKIYNKMRDIALSDIKIAKEENMSPEEGAKLNVEQHMMNEDGTKVFDTNAPAPELEPEYPVEEIAQKEAEKQVQASKKQTVSTDVEKTQTSTGAGDVTIAPRMQHPEDTTPTVLEPHTPTSPYYIAPKNSSEQEADHALPPVPVSTPNPNEQGKTIEKAPAAPLADPDRNTPTPEASKPSNPQTDKRAPSEAEPATGAPAPSEIVDSVKEILKDQGKGSGAPEASMSTISSSITKGGWEDGSTAQAVESKEDGSTKVKSTPQGVSNSMSSKKGSKEDGSQD